MSRHLPAAVALMTSGLLGAGLALTSLPAYAGPSSTGSSTASNPLYALTAATHHVAPLRLSASRLADVRSRQRRMRAQHTAAPAFGSAVGGTVQRLTVTTTEDSGLADPSDTHCIDAASGACSLRAAVEAANNRAVPVRIVLGPETYVLNSATELLVTNPGGTSIVGRGSDETAIQGAGSRVLHLAGNELDPSAPVLYLSDLTVTGGSTDASGGGIYAGTGTAGGAVALNGVRVSDNTAHGAGGGIYTSGETHLYATDSAITDNVAFLGGGLYTYWADVDLTDVDVTGNHGPDAGPSYGGGWYRVYGVGRVTRGSISGNTSGVDSETGAGAAVSDEYGNLTLTGVHVDHNTAHGNAVQGSVGGGLYLYHDLLQVTGGSISHNQALSSGAMGGGLFLDSAQAELHGVNLAGDRVDPEVTSGFGGGALYVGGSNGNTQVTIDRGSRIHGATGSAVYVNNGLGGRTDLDVDGSRLWANSDLASNGPAGADDTGCGGAICAILAYSGRLNLTMSSDVVASNTSAGHGGSGGVTVWSSNTSAARVHLLRSTFEFNATGAGGLGGALGVHGDSSSSASSIRLQANGFVGNQAGTASETGNGGAVGVDSDGTTVSDHGSAFGMNTASGPDASGGAVYTETGQTSAYTGSTFTKNAAGRGGVGHGGAVFADDGSGTTFTGVSVTRNRSGRDGGGIEAASHTENVAVIRSTVAGNVAGHATVSGSGGGLLVDSAALVVESSTLTGNRAVQGSSADDVATGGGIYLGGGSLGVRYATVSGNVAAQGGGIYSAAPGGVLLGSIVSANHGPTGGEQDCSFAVAANSLHSLGGNVVGQAGCVRSLLDTDVVKRNPRLRALADNGGPTRTMALRATSPAVGLVTSHCPDTDQRGRHRPASHCDAGAFELPKVKKPHHR
ncbi:MAG: choice-of-anchor Q domain-containing protein [Nocardioides sp.]